MLQSDVQPSPLLAAAAHGAQLSTCPAPQGLSGTAKPPALEHNSPATSLSLNILKGIKLRLRMSENRWVLDIFNSSGPMDKVLTLYQYASSDSPDQRATQSLFWA